MQCCICRNVCNRGHREHRLHRFSAAKYLTPHLSPTTLLTTSHSKNHLRQMSQYTNWWSLHTSMNHPRVSQMCKTKNLMIKMRA